ncbi:hypothetical protein J6590_040404 [Homalodisca vitripennis]|nr:hypothetical protein J6590_040404 [Homalodisca vitripennis]
MLHLIATLKRQLAHDHDLFLESVNDLCLASVSRPPIWRTNLLVFVLFFKRVQTYHFVFPANSSLVAQNDELPLSTIDK